MSTLHPLTIGDPPHRIHHLVVGIGLMALGALLVWHDRRDWRVAWRDLRRWA